MNYLTPEQVLFIHSRLVTETGGSHGLRDLALLESAVARPRATFDSKEFYPDLFTKAAALMDLPSTTTHFWMAINVQASRRLGYSFGSMDGNSRLLQKSWWPAPCAWQWKVWRLMNLPIGFGLKP
jgi:hypothetical protein